jgi:hypothetical protein
MTNAYQFNNFETAANLLHQLNNFLLGFGTGIDDLPSFNTITFDVKDRSNPYLYYKRYYEKYAPLVLKCVGIYQRQVLDKIKVHNMFPHMEA